MEDNRLKLKPEKVNAPIVSVCMISYGHEKYIEEAINGVLIQECDFEIELVISNDCSPDKTDDIIQKILKTHHRAHIIKYFRHKKNLGMMPNSIFAIEQCKGEYIASCEGDDFWTDKLKLKKQIDFLRKNQNCSLCFHNAEVIYEDTKRTRLFVTEYHKTFYTGEDILKKWLIPTASMVFVNLFKENKFPVFFAKAVHGDLALQLLLFEHGDFGLINENMCTYRINENGATQTFFNTLPYKYAYIEQLKEMKIYFKGKYNKYFNKSIIDQNVNIIEYYNTTNIIKQFIILFKIMTVESNAIIKYNKEVYLANKIIVRNIINKLKKTVKYH